MTGELPSGCEVRQCAMKVSLVSSPGPFPAFQCCTLKRKAGNGPGDEARFHQIFRLNSTSRFVAKSLLDTKIDTKGSLLSLALMKELAGRYSEGAILYYFKCRRELGQRGH